MINPPKDESEQLAMDAFKDLKPFTIVINKVDDAMFLSLALLNKMTGDDSLTNDALIFMINHAKLAGVDQAVDHFFEEANDEQISYPEFLKPILKIMLGHIFEHRERISDLVNKEKEK